MNDVEKIMKINEMSQELKKHGFAESSEDAAVQAKKFYDEKAAENVGIKEEETEEKEESEKGSEESEEESKVEEKEGVVSPSDNGASDVERVERNFEMFKGSISEELKTLKADVHNIIEKMNEMVKAINDLEKMKKAATTFDDNGEKQSRLAPKSEGEKPAEPRGTSETNHPRSGDMQPGDINLNETFYFGNK